MKIICRLFLAILLCSSFSCQQPLDDWEIEYLGNWSSNKYYLEIAKNGRGYLEKRGFFGFDGVEGRIYINNNRIKFRSDSRNKTFHIDERPYRDRRSGFIMMVLDGDEFYKQ